MDFLILCAMAVGFFFTLNPNLSLLYSRDWWAFACMIFCCLMTSGQIWNEIESPPFFNSNTFFAVHYQCILESFLVMILYFSMAFGLIMIIEAAARKGNLEKRQTQATNGVTVLFLFFALLIAMVRNKTQ